MKSEEGKEVEKEKKQRKKRNTSSKDDDETKSMEEKEPIETHVIYSPSPGVEEPRSTEQTPLPPLFVSVLAKTKSAKPTAVQSAVWSILLREPNFNLIAISPTGSGKTLAYGLPLVRALLEKEDQNSALILLPTRELASQVHGVLRSIIETARSTLRCVLICGGEEEMSGDFENCVACATPGRMLKVLETRDIRPRLVVLDEADRLLKHADLKRQVEEIVEGLGGARWSFSASGGGGAEEEFVPTPRCAVRVDAMAGHGKRVDFRELTRIPAHVRQVLHVCSVHKKPKKLLHTLGQIKSAKSRRGDPLTMVFFSKIKTLSNALHLLKGQGHKCAELHGKLPQSRRTETLAQFRAGKVRLLLVTDLAARGIHVPNVEYVVNYDFPSNLDQYVHRCGRAGRQRDGTATVYSFFNREMKPMAEDVLRLLRIGQAWIDPNLLALTGEEPPVKKRRRKKSKSKQVTTVIHREIDDVDEFAALGKDVTLKRAGHVSDPSDDDGV